MDLLNNLHKKFFKTIFNEKGEIIPVDFQVTGKEYNIKTWDDQQWTAIKEILLIREYEYLSNFSLDKFKNKIVVDGGSHTGLYSMVASRFADKVVAIEPHPKNYELLIKNISNNKIENIIPVNKALWYQDEMIEFYESTGKSCEHSAFKNENYSNKINVPTVRLPEIISQFGKIDLLKIDIEGAEFDIFKNLSREECNKIHYITGEIHDEMGSSSELVESLKESNFQVKVLTPPFENKKPEYEINLNDYKKLKTLRRLFFSFYNVSGIKDNRYSFIFAENKNYAGK